MSANANVPQVAGDPGVPVDEIGLHLFGTGELQTSAGRGVKNGIPYGEQLERERRDLNRMYRFRPGAAASLRAATRKALGRG